VCRVAGHWGIRVAVPSNLELPTRWVCIRMEMTGKEEQKSGAPGSASKVKSRRSKLLGGNDAPKTDY
jgi:hypothetical protein